jgi:DNA invertase Pin-like site-specific DNA recombinase
VSNLFYAGSRIWKISAAMVVFVFSRCCAIGMGLPEMKDTCWQYLVVSSRKQLESLDTDKLWAQEAAAQNGWILTREPFTGDSTGKDGPRKLLQTLLSELRDTPKSKRPQYILMTRLDRVGRGRLVDSQIILRDIYDLGSQIFTRQEGFVWLDSPMDELIAAVKHSTASQENLNRRDKARSGHLRRKRRGLHDGHAPYGTTLVEGKPVAQEPQASIIRMMFAMRHRGEGLHVVTEYARQHGPPKIRSDGTTRVLTWNKASVRLMLHCATYRGVVVDPDVFDAVNAMVTHGMYPLSTEGSWPLRGAVHCSCGRRLSGRMSGLGTWRHRYYVCTNHPGEMRVPHFPADAVEDAYLAFLGRLKASDALNAVQPSPKRILENGRETVRSIEAQIAQVNSRRQRAWEMAETANIPPAELSRRLVEHDESLQRLETAMQRAQEEIGRSAHAAQAVAAAKTILADVVREWGTFNPIERARVALAIARALPGEILLTRESTSRTITVEWVPHSQSDDNGLQNSPHWGWITELARDPK